MKSRRLDSAATVLPAGFRDASYQFHQVTIAGVKERQPRWQDAVQQMNGGLGVTGPLLRVFDISHVRADAFVLAM